MKNHKTGEAVGVCPACGSDVFETVGGPASAFRCDEVAILEHPSYEIRECKACGLYYKSHVLMSESLHAYYSKLDFTPFDCDDGFPTDAALLTKLRRLQQGSRVLDFGCSTGRILAALGTGYVRFGVEINAAAAAEAQRRGIRIIAESDIRDVNPFDAIILTDVFEHLIEPTATLRRLVKRLRPGGQLFIVTGLADAARPRALISEHWYFRICGHLQMLSQRHLNWLGRTMGLTVASVEMMSHYKRLPALRAKQLLQAAIYETVKLAPTSAMAAVVRRVPGLKRASSWPNLPATSQSKDHVVVQLRKC